MGSVWYFGMIPLMEREVTPPAISVIIPTRNEAENIRPLLTRLSSLNETAPMELIFVDDSDDGTPETIAELKDHLVIPISVIHRSCPAAKWIERGRSGRVPTSTRCLDGGDGCGFTASP